MKYKIVYQQDGKIKTLKLNDLENLPKNIIKIQEKKVFPSFQLKQNHKKNILYMFEQLTIMLNANITLSEAIDLSLKTEQDKTIREILLIMQNSITSGKPIDKALQKYDSILGVTWGSGIGCGLVVNNELFSNNLELQIHQKNLFPLK